MQELKLNCTLYFSVPAGKDPGQYVNELMQSHNSALLTHATDVSSDWDWEKFDPENYDWQPV